MLIQKSRAGLFGRKAIGRKKGRQRNINVSKNIRLKKGRKVILIICLKTSHMVERHNHSYFLFRQYNLFLPILNYQQIVQKVEFQNVDNGIYYSQFNHFVFRPILNYQQNSPKIVCLAINHIVECIRPYALRFFSTHFFSTH